MFYIRDGLIACLRRSIKHKRECFIRKSNSSNFLRYTSFLSSLGVEYPDEYTLLVFNTLRDMCLQYC